MRKIFVLLCTMAVVLAGSTGALPKDYSFGDSPLNSAVEYWLSRTARPLSPALLATKYRVYNMVCFELRSIDCSGVPAPNVEVFSRNPLRPGLAGFYRGGDTVYIRDDLMGREREEVLAHEMSHYLDVMVYGMVVPNVAEVVCVSERDAWAVSDAYWRKYGYFGKIIGKKWVNWYRHCTPLKDVLYPNEIPS